MFVTCFTVLTSKASRRRTISPQREFLEPLQRQDKGLRFSCLHFPEIRCRFVAIVDQTWLQFTDPLTFSIAATLSRYSDEHLCLLRAPFGPKPPPIHSWQPHHAQLVEILAVGPPDASPSSSKHRDQKRVLLCLSRYLFPT
jgi:hypothetical protein